MDTQRGPKRKEREGKGRRKEKGEEEEEADFGPGPQNNEDLSFLLYTVVVVRCLRIFILSNQEVCPRDTPM